jgi:hypothetical protein
MSTPVPVIHRPHHRPHDQPQDQPRHRPQRRLWPLLLLAGLLLAGALAAGLWLAVERAPRVQGQGVAVSVDDIDRARRLLERNDPRNALPGITRAVLLSQRDLELVIQQAGQRLGGGGAAGGRARGRVRLQPGLALVEASLALPANPWGGWLNLRAVLRETEALPAVQQLRIGQLPVPGWLAEAALPRLLAVLNLRAQGELAQRLVSRVGFRSQALVLAYAWPDNPEQLLTESLLSPDDQVRVRRHASHLATLAATLAGNKPKPAVVSVTALIQPMFALAAANSRDAASAALENRAAFVALAFLASGQGLAPLLGQAPGPAHAAAPGRPPIQTASQPASQPPGPAATALAGKPSPAMRAPEMRLRGRPDWPLHLLISAALAAEGGGPLSDAIGLYKEVADSRHGSGFSFGDLAADRAGTRLGLAARRDPLGLQARLARGVQEADLLPEVSDLPEDMQEPEFKRRFGGVGAPGHRAMLREIETRLDQLPLLAAVR